MSFYIIQGGNRLEGSLAVHGAKNSVLPILAAATLCDDCRLSNCPHLTDVEVAMDILRHLGCSAMWQEDEIL
ncbi:MAG: UDP-N-acetylglucosamine 1-carboxyvinyltransferase, partial [Angelakisella sp.]